MPSNTNNTQVAQFKSIAEIKQEGQDKINQSTRNFCIDCSKVLDGTGYYGATQANIDSGEYLFCTANPLPASKGLDFTSLVTGKKLITIIEGEAEEDGFLIGTNCSRNEPAIKYKQCLDIRDQDNPDCPDFEKKEIEQKMQK